MADTDREIKVVKSADRSAILRADERERCRRELKKIKDELLTLARRVETLANEAAQVTTK